ncbi:hypothetical protein STSO111631_18655 [Stackebrandtia soli]
MAFAVVGVGSPAEATFSAPDRVFTSEWLRFTAPEPTDLLPGNTHFGSTGSLATALYEGLTRIDPETGEPVAAAAEHWSSSDQQSWTFTLRDGMTFHNGDPVTAQSFVDAWEFTANPSHNQYGQYQFSMFEGYGSGIIGVTATSDTELTVKLAEPWSTFPIALADPAFAPLPDDCVTSVDACAHLAIGNGPFHMQSEWAPGESLRLTAWKEHHDGPVQYGGIEFTFGDDQERFLAMLASNDADMVVSEERDLAEVPSTVTLPSSRLTSLVLPDEKPYKKTAIREAISGAIDRAELTGAFGSAATAADGFVPPMLPGALEGSCENCVHDPEGAKAAFKDAKWPKKTKLRIGHFESSMQTTTAEVLCRQLSSALGVDCELKPESDYVAYLERMASPSYPMIGSWLPDQATAESFLRQYYQEYLGVDDEELAALVDEGNAAGNVQGAAGGFGEAQRRLDELMPVVPLMYGNTSVALSDMVVPESVVLDRATNAIRVDLIELRPAED